MHDPPGQAPVHSVVREDELHCSFPPHPTPIPAAEAGGRPSARAVWPPLLSRPRRLSASGFGAAAQAQTGSEEVCVLSPPQLMGDMGTDAEARGLPMSRGHAGPRTQRWTSLLLRRAPKKTVIVWHVQKAIDTQRQVWHSLPPNLELPKSKGSNSPLPIGRHLGQGR